MTESNVNPEHIHLILDRMEIVIVIDALQTVGNLELAQRFEAVLRQTGQATQDDLEP